jgi:hypothetical protein
MPVDIKQAGAVIGFMHQVVVPDFVVQRGRFGHERKLQESCDRFGARSAPAKGNVGASRRARNFRGRRSGETSEKAAGQAGAIVDHDAPSGHAGLNENHLECF